MERWKVKTGLTDGNKGEREITIVLAKYGDDNMPIQRHMTSFPETASNEEVIAALRDLADGI